jgi:hypothetical protein
MKNQTIFLRLKITKNISKSSRFSFLKGIKSILHNFNVLFTGKLLSGELGWIEDQSKELIVDDVSLIMDDGNPKFVKTSEGEKNVLMTLTKILKD